MTRNRDSMSVADMIRVCAMSGSVIMVAMLLLGAMMISQKPEARLELAAAPAVPTYAMPLEKAAEPGVAVAAAVPAPTAKVEPAS